MSVGLVNGMLAHPVVFIHLVLMRSVAFWCPGYLPLTNLQRHYQLFYSVGQVWYRMLYCFVDSG